LVEQGMPAHVGGISEGWQLKDSQSWQQYWGTTTCDHPDFGLAWGAPGFKQTTRIEGDHEIVESENGAITRQVLNNDITYSMPEYIQFPVRDRASWEFYKERMTPTQFMTREDMLERSKKFDSWQRPLAIGTGSGYGRIRGLMGPEAASFIFYDDPELVHDIVRWHMDQIREYVFPMIERIKPDIVAFGEDVCYNHAMLCSPAHFDQFFGAMYREICDCAIANEVPVRAIDTDGNAMEFTGLVESYGVNAIYPYEVKSNNDLFKLREEHPEFIFFGWLEKEVVNEGNEALIKPEIMNKVPALIEKGGYFPNGDHGIQPLVTFENLCKFMTLLHEVCGNPQGEFPRMTL